MKTVLFRFLSKIALQKKQRQYWKTRYQLLINHKNNDINIPDYALKHVELHIRGHHNKVNIGKIHFPSKGRLRIKIYGNNNSISISDDVRCSRLDITVGESSPSSPSAHNTSVSIGAKSTFLDTTIFTSHSNARIEIGSGCMFSSGIVIHHTDSHPIYELGNPRPINGVDTLKIGNHVWVGLAVTIWKNVTIADDCILGAHAMIAKSFHTPHCAIAGNPARIIRRNITWESTHTKEYIENKPLDCYSQCP